MAEGRWTEVEGQVTTWEVHGLRSDNYTYRKKKIPKSRWDRGILATALWSLKIMSDTPHVVRHAGEV